MQNRQLAEQIKQGKAPIVIDVRSAAEFRAGHIPGALHLPVATLPFRRGAIPGGPDGLLVLTCEHGPRAQLAAGVLRMLGFKRLELLEGHMAAWRKAGLPVES